MASIERVFRGLELIMKYCEPNAYCLCAEHDVLYAGDEPEKMTPEDRAKMKELGWFDQDGACWAIFI